MTTGVVLAVLAKVVFELCLTAGTNRPLFHCSKFVDNDHCSFVEWLLNPGDLIVMLPAFVAGCALAAVVAWARPKQL